ncbi:MAG TPA: POTRA domain-containing protein [Thermoanaerobaculia bacterium]|nr:POTRA domain-containing protein [Thermoanaerobaculia bacterium]
MTYPILEVLRRHRLALLPLLAAGWLQARPALGWGMRPPPVAPLAPAAADAPSPAPAPERPVIGEVRIVTQGIFNPDRQGEDKLAFRLADRLHRTTRPQVIRRQLLFAPGDPYEEATIEESERLLRANRYLYDAEINAVRQTPERVDLEVVTRDVWTLRGGVSVNRAGGENSTNFSLQDANFLGTGKDVTVWRTSDVDRDSTLFRYRDPNLFGKRGELHLSVAENSDGDAQRFELERPWFSLDTRWSLGIKLWSYERLDPLYDRGIVFERFRHHHDFAQLYGGLSRGRAEGRAHRFLLGVDVERDRFDFQPGGDSTSLVPPNRDLRWPWLGYEYVEDGFVTERNLDQIRRTEDLNLGTQLRVRLGWSSPDLGADRERLMMIASADAGWRPGPRQLLLTSLRGGGRYRDAAENLLLSGRARYYLRHWGDQVFYFGLEADYAQDLDVERQLLLGGDSGLRGYPLRFLRGDRRLLATVEQRFFSQREFFRLFHLGAAIFFDAGSAWFRSSLDDPEVLRDIGIGLRVGSSRSSGGSMIHLDVAFPLDGDDTIEGVQWLVSTSERF